MSRVFSCKSPVGRSEWNPVSHLDHKSKNCLAAWDTLVVHFYRATLCVSEVLSGVRPSVCLSVRHVRVAYCIQTAEDIVEQARWRNDSAFLSPKRTDTQLQGNHSAGALNTRGGKSSLTSYFAYTLGCSSLTAVW